MREDPRVRRTRHALVEAFNRLVLGRHRQIRVPDVVAEARVGRSTFYDHYSSAEELHMEALRRPLAPLADAAAGKGDEAALAHILAHFWAFRQRARQTFGDKTERLLAEMVEARLGNGALLIPPPIAARQLAAAALAPVIAWLGGAAPCTAEALACSICRSGRVQAEALAPDKEMRG